MANRFTVSTTFAAVDQMSGPMGKMQGSTRKLGQASGQTGEQVKASGGKMGGAMKGLAAGLTVVVGAATAAGAAVFGLARQAQEAADSIADTAGALGISNKALQEYRYVAQLSGMSAADMDSAIQKLTLNLGKGGNEMAATLGMLGLTVEQVKAAGPDRVLELIADGMQGVQDSAARAAIVTQLFGKSSVRMVNALGGGSEAIASLREEANALGYVMDDAAIAAGGKMGDAMDRLKLSGQGLLNMLGGSLVPMVTQIAESIQGLMVANRPQIIAIVAQLSGVFQQFWNTIQGVLPSIMDAVSKLLEAVGPALGKLLPVVGQLIGVLMPIVAELLSALAPVLYELAALVGDTVGQLLVILGPALKVATKLFKALMPVISKVVDILAKVLAPVLEVLGPLIEVLAEFLAPVIDVLVAILMPALEIIGGHLERLAKILKIVLLPVIVVLSKALRVVADFLAFMGQKVRDVLGAVGVHLSNAGAFGEKLAEKFAGIVPAIGDMFLKAFSGLVEFVKGAYEFVASLATKIGDVFAGIFEGLVGFVQGIVAWIDGALGGVLGKIGSAIGAVGEFLGLGGGGALQPAAVGAGATPISSNSTMTSRTGIDVNFRNAPAGTSVRQTGQTAPGVTLRLGVAGTR